MEGTHPHISSFVLAELSVFIKLSEDKVTVVFCLPRTKIV